MKMILAFGLGLVALVLTACGETNATADASLANTDVRDIHLDADAAWAALTSSGAPVVRMPGETPYERFLREVEFSKQRRRELGLNFWRDFPDDPRRYSWLTRAVFLAPVYPVDIEAWAKAQAAFDEPFPEAAYQLYLADIAVDTDAIAEWEAVYPALRAEFWAAADVTDVQRRLLQEAEFIQEAWAIKRATLREEEHVGVETYADRVLAHYRSSPGAYEYWFLRKITQEICTNLDTFGLDEAGFATFTDELRSINAGFDEFVGAALVDFCSEEARTPVNTPRAKQRFLIANSLIYSAAPETQDGLFIYLHFKEEAARRRQGMMPIVWDEIAPESKKTLLWNSIGSPGRYYSQLIDGLNNDLRAMDELVWRPTDYAQDEGALSQKTQQYAFLLDDFVNDPAVTKQAVLSILGYQLQVAGGQEIAKVIHGDDTANIHRHLDDIYSFYREHGQDGMGSVFRAVRGVINNKQTLNLDPALADEFLEKFDHPWIERLATGRENRIALRSTPIELAGPTLSGDYVDVTDLRGKIVLLKFWSTSCSSCIAAMPKVQGIYDDYRDRGFEVVAVSSDAEERRARVERIVARAGSTWPTVIGDAYFDELDARFGFGNVVPQYMLIGRDGLLAADTDEIEVGRNLQALLDAMLAEEAAAIQAEGG